MQHVGRASHLGPVVGRGRAAHLSVEFVNVGGWLTHGDAALDSCAQFLVVAEHKLIPAMLRSTGHQLRKANRQSGRLHAQTRLLGVMPVSMLSVCEKRP